MSVSPGPPTAPAAPLKGNQEQTLAAGYECGELHLPIRRKYIQNESPARCWTVAVSASMAIYVYCTRVNNGTSNDMDFRTI